MGALRGNDWAMLVLGPKIEISLVPPPPLPVVSIAPTLGITDHGDLAKEKGDVLEGRAIVTASVFTDA
jgi:hypothetical protein